MMGTPSTSTSNENVMPRYNIPQVLILCVTVSKTIPSDVSTKGDHSRDFPSKRSSSGIREQGSTVQNKLLN